MSSLRHIRPDHRGDTVMNVLYKLFLNTLRDCWKTQHYLIDKIVLKQFQTRW